MKRILCLLLVVLTLAALLAGCGEKKTLHCDRCGKEVKVSMDSKMEEDWIIYCSDCEKELGLDEIVPKN